MSVVKKIFTMADAELSDRGSLNVRLEVSFLREGVNRTVTVAKQNHF